ncbi:MAG: type II secretion system protein GspC [Gammaproteobacteria bacterium]|nr:type II secretion system protein GspC [Gammaproteobacteria bacterium]
MLQDRINEWWSRWPANGPWLLAALFSVLIAVELAHLAVSLLGGGAPAPIATPLPRVATAPPVDTAGIVSAHLFGIATVDPAAQNPANAPPTTANLTLAGTIATQNPKRGLAIIAMGGPSKVYSVGDAIGGASLYAVYLDRVVLDRGGRLETLKLPKILATGAPGAMVVPARNATVQTLQNLRQMVERNPNALNHVLRAVPSYDNRAGRLRGFRLYPGRDRRAFSGLGLRPGDLVTAIDGTPLDDPQRGQQIFDTIESSSQAQVTVDRNGQTLQLSLDIAKVVAEASRDMAPPPTPQPFRHPTFNLNP